MHPAVQIVEAILQPGGILVPTHAVDSRGRRSLQRVVALPQSIDRQMMEQCGELLMRPSLRRLAHTTQSAGRGFPTLRPVRVGLCRVSPWSTGFPPQPPPPGSPAGAGPSCSVASSVLPVVRLLAGVRVVVRLAPSPTGLPLLPTDTDEVSRFSCRKFLGVRGVFDRAGPGADSRCHLRRCGLPHQSMASAPETSSFTAPYPAHRCLCQRFTRGVATAGA